jgi:hypothetical protein
VYGLKYSQKGKPPEQQREELIRVYIRALIDDLPASGIQLQAKNRDFWDTYDRQLAEAQFRLGIFPPLLLIIFLLSSASNHWAWLLLFPVPLFLLFLGYQQFISGAETLVQAVVLKIVEPPVLARLRETVANKREEEAIMLAAGKTKSPT